MSAELLRVAGETLYGSRWQTELARNLSVSDRTMRRWAAGGDSIPHGVARDLLRMCEERERAIGALRERLKAIASA